MRKGVLPRFMKGVEECVCVKDRRQEIHQSGSIKYKAGKTIFPAVKDEDSQV